MSRARRALSGLHTDEHRLLVAVLAEARTNAGLTQYQLADLLGVDQPYVSKYESGQRRIDVVELVRISDVLKVNPSAILRQVWPNHF